MSDDVKETCRSYVAGYQTRYGHGVFAGEELQRVVTKEECGVDLEDLTENDETKRLFEAAKRTGHPAVLSKEDALAQAATDEFLEGSLASGLGCTSPVRHIGSLDRYQEEVRECVGVKLKSARLQKVLGDFVEREERIIQQRADRFLEDAKALVERLKK